MLSLYYCFQEFLLDDSRFNLLTKELPDSVVEKIMQYKHPVPRQLTLLGKVLLSRALRDVNPSLSMDNIVVGTHNKPSLPGGPFFNISHSYNCVVCAVSDQSDLGVDVEMHREVAHESFHRIFTEVEISEFSAHPEPSKLFFERWAQKEAVLKADGRGMALSPKKITILPGKAHIQDGSSWTLSEIPVRKGYSCWLAHQSEPGPEIIPVSVSLF